MWPRAFFQSAFAIANIKIYLFFHSSIDLVGMRVSSRPLHLSFYHNATIQLNSKNIYKILLFVSYYAGLCEQEFIITPQGQTPAYLPQGDGLPKAENVLTWQRCSEVADKPQIRQMLTQLQNKFIHSILSTKYYMSGPVAFLSFPYVIFYISSFICLSGQSNTITLLPIKPRGSQGLGPYHIN